jgi:hypothetical protein
MKERFSNMDRPIYRKTNNLINTEIERERERKKYGKANKIKILIQRERAKNIKRQRE